MTKTTFPAAPEFPDYHTRTYSIAGETVTAETLTRTQGGRELVSAVCISAPEKARNLIRNSIEAKGVFVHNPINPITSTKDSNALYIEDPNRLLSAIQILEQLDTDLRYLAIVSEVTGDKTHVQPARGIEAYTTGIDDNRQKLLIAAVYHALDVAYGCENIDRSTLNTIIKNARQAFNFNTVNSAFDVPAEKRAASADRKTPVIVSALNEARTQVITAVEDAAIKDSSAEKAETFKKHFMAEIRQAIRTSLSPPKPKSR